jgi:hypothetical protein
LAPAITLQDKGVHLQSASVWLPADWQENNRRNFGRLMHDDVAIHIVGHITANVFVHQAQINGELVVLFA